MIDISCYFIILFKVNLGHVRVHWLSPANASLKRYASFDLALAIAALIGVGWQGGFISNKFYPPSDASSICPLVKYFVLQSDFSNNPAFRKNIYGSAPFTGIPL